MIKTEKSIKSNRRPPSANGNKVLNFLFFCSLASTVWGIQIYRVTIIEGKYLLVVCILGVAVANLVLSLFVTSSYSRIWNLSLRSIIGAGISYFAILFLNQQFASKSLVRAEFKIIEAGSLARGKGVRCSQPYVVIDFHGKLKQLICYCGKEYEVQHSQKVILQYTEGAFGFAVIESSQLVG